MADALPTPITRADLLKIALDTHHELAIHTNDFDEPDYSVMIATLHATSDLIHALVADTLHDSAQKISKITDAIHVETKKLNSLVTNLQDLQNFAGQAADVINAVMQFLPYLA